MSTRESVDTEQPVAPAESGHDGAVTRGGTGGLPDLSDPNLTRFDLVRESARRDGVEIVVYEPRFPPGSRLERRMERTVASLFLLAGALATAFLVIYIWWPWEYVPQDASALSKLYTPLLGVTLGGALLLLGIAIISWVKKLMPHEIAVEERHDGPSDPDDRRLLAATAAHALDETGIARRPLLKGALTLGLLPLAAVAAAPLIGGLIRNPHRSEEPGLGSPQEYTGWNPAFNNGRPVRLVREDGTPVRPSDVSVAGQVTVFPGIPGGTTNEFASSPVLLIHLRQEDADLLRSRLYEINKDSMEGNFVAYSKICTHAGCPPSLFEQQTNRLLCPCHQSQFLITDNARPVFGPATRSLAMLPLALDEEGFFVAGKIDESGQLVGADFPVPVGPSYWER